MGLKQRTILIISHYWNDTNGTTIIYVCGAAARGLTNMLLIEEIYTTMSLGLELNLKLPKF